MMIRNVLALVALAAAGSANAAVLFSDDFNTDVTALTVTSLPGWTVTGNVDVVNTGSYGITCDVKCIDLDGTTGPGRIESVWVPFAAGQTITASYDLSGSQRSSAADFFRFEFGFAAPTDLLDLTTLSGFPGAPVNLGNYPGISTIYNEYDVPGGQGFIPYSISFKPVQSGQFQVRFWTTSSDNIGPILDNVIVTQTTLGTNAVPEPATWAMLIAGFGLVGAALRRQNDGASMRRRRAIAA